MINRISLLVFAGFLIGSPCSAQVYIAESSLRSSLNAAIPGLVDGAGVMDTLHPGIPLLDSVSISVHTSTATIDLEALSYLDSVSVMHINAMHVSEGHIDVFIPGLPATLDVLSMSSGNCDLLIDWMPEIMSSINFFYGSPTNPTYIQIVHPPEYIEQINLNDVDSIVWNDTITCENINLSYFGLCNIHLSPLIADFMHINQYTAFNTNLSMTQVQHLVMNYWVDGPIQWPQGVTELLLGGTVSVPVTTWPPDLDTLIVDDGDFCIPPLPNTISDLWFSHYQPDCLPNWPDSLDHYLGESDWVYENTAVYCSVLNSTCPGAYPGISGRLLIDTNENGQCDAGEPPLPQATIALQPTGNVVGCDQQGNWQIGVFPGVYTIEPAANYPYAASITPPQHSADVSAMSNIDTDNDFAVALIPDIEDLRAYFHAAPARPGFDNRLYLTCQNYGTVAMDATLTLEYDADQTWVGSSVTPDVVAGNTVTWNFPAMAIGATQSFTVDLNTAAGVALGTAITHVITATPTLGDETPPDNVVLWNDSVVGSFDPNDKLVSPIALSPAQVQSGTLAVEYTVRFQNTGTFMAERVVILDTLSADLRWESLQMLASSHANHWYVVNGVLHVIHEGINLPDSTSNEPGSHGFIKFSILPQPGLQDGSTVANIAHIVFDFNDPIITPPAVFAVDIQAGTQETSFATMTVYPNPVHDRLRIVANTAQGWNGQYAILDLVGRTLLQGRVNDAGSVDVSTLHDGAYMLQLLEADFATPVRFVKR